MFLWWKRKSQCCSTTILAEFWSCSYEWRETNAWDFLRWRFFLSPINCFNWLDGRFFLGEWKSEKESVSLVLSMHLLWWTDGEFSVSGQWGDWLHASVNNRLFLQNLLVIVGADGREDAKTSPILLFIWQNTWNKVVVLPLPPSSNLQCLNYYSDLLLVIIHHDHNWGARPNDHVGFLCAQCLSFR